jgi:hypothetical protein
MCNGQKQSVLCRLCCAGACLSSRGLAAQLSPQRSAWLRDQAQPGGAACLNPGQCRVAYSCSYTWAVLLMLHMQPYAC